MILLIAVLVTVVNIMLFFAARRRYALSRPKTARQVLDAIDAYMVDSGVKDSGQLWDVLTALRGPDSQSFGLKHDITCPIRRAAFPRMARLNRRLQPAAFGTGQRYESTGLPDPGHPEFHFIMHGRLAAAALGLST